MLFCFVLLQQSPNGSIMGNNMRGMVPPNVASPPNMNAGQASSNAPGSAPTSTTNKKGAGGKVTKPKRSRGRNAAAASAAVAAVSAAVGSLMAGLGGG